MKSIAVFLAPALAAPLLIFNALASSVARPAYEQPPTVDLRGRWALNQDLSETRAAGTAVGDETPGVEGAPGRRGGGRPGGGGPPGGGGGFPGGRGGVPGARGGAGGDRSSPEDIAKMRDAMRAVMEAPPEMIITGHDDELVFTSANGDIRRILVTGKKMKTTAGGAEHDVKATYKGNELVVESTFGPLKLVDTYRLSADGARLERVTETAGGPARRDGGKPRPLRRIYDRIR